MSLPPPKLRNLPSVVQCKDSEIQEVWEIGVPAKRSLFWSVMLSYLISCSDAQFEEFLIKIKGPRVSPKDKQTRSRSRSCSSNAKVIRKVVKNFNPFKNRHVFFHNPDIVNVMQNFKKKLNRYAYELKQKLKSDEWNDAFKLKAASELLKCKLEIYYPGSIPEGPLCFSSSVSSEILSPIILFQYEDQTYGSRTENINIFRFAMTTEYAHNLKLEALVHILTIAKLSNCEPKKIQEMLYPAITHGKNFLPTLLQSRYFDVLPDLYKSPYIALKLSEAGFETNPADIDPRKPSPFLYAMTKSDTKYIRILYDYAVNCRYLFENTVRDADDTVLESIQKLYNILENDKSHITCRNLKNTGKVQTLNRIFSYFNEFQQEIVKACFNLKTQLHEIEEKSHSLKSERTKAGKEILNIRKQVVQSILESYSKFFYYKEFHSIHDKYDNYINFTEYYENIDFFSCLLFFDNIYLLKKIFQVENEDIYANVESTFFFLIVSSKYFKQYEHDIMDKSVHDETEYESSGNTLRIIPLLYRENLREEIHNFEQKLMSKESLIPKEKITGDRLMRCLSAFPVIKDELLVSKIKLYLKVSSEIELQEDGIYEDRMKGILAIERVLQVIGESVKPQSTEDCVVSCLLGSRIPEKIKKDLTVIRNDLSHYKYVSADRRIEFEQNIEFFAKLQSDLKEIRESFEIVAFSQYLRLQEYLIEKGQEELNKHQLDQSFINNYLEDSKRINHRKKYDEHKNECIKLSLNIISDFRTHISENSRSNVKDETVYNANTDRFLNSIKYVFSFIYKISDEEFFNTFLQEVQKCYQEYENKKEFHSFREYIDSLFEKYIESVKIKFPHTNFSNSLLTLPAIESFLKPAISNSVHDSDINLITDAITKCYDEAIEAKNELINLIKHKTFNSGKEELLLKRFIISPANLKKLRNSYKNRKYQQVLKELEKPFIEKNKLLNTVKGMFEKNSIDEGEARALIIKLTNQRHLTEMIYTGVNLNESFCDRLQNILTKKAQFLLSRIRIMKYILIDDDDEINAAWTWGRSKGIKYHTKFLMRQRFIREIPVRAALEMALFDCLNILHSEDFREVYEKLNNLFTGMNLRNVLAHGHSLLETTSGLIDEDDLPSELINKMLYLIEDSEAVESMLKLIPISATLEKEIFQEWIESIASNCDDEEHTFNVENYDTFKEAVKKIAGCQRWRSYLYLLPLQ